MTPDDEMVTSYLTCALWASSGSDVESLDERYSLADVSPEARLRAEADCAYFLSRAWAFVLHEDLGTVGHDLWLTRNGHGVGFWDGDYPEHGDVLTAIARAMGEINLYPGDDGKLYFM